MDESRFRLRTETGIVGYMKTIHNTTFFSKDGYGWSGNEIDFTFKDRFSGLFDQNRKPLYAEDIIEISIHPNLYLILHSDASLNTFQLIDFETFVIFAPDALELIQRAKWVKRISYTFIN